MTPDSQQKDVNFSEPAVKPDPDEELQFSLVLEVNPALETQEVSAPPQKDPDRDTDIEKTKKYIQSLYKPKPIMTVARIVPDGNHPTTVGFFAPYKNSKSDTKYPPKKPMLTAREPMYRELADLPDEGKILESLEKDKKLVFIGASNKPSRFPKAPQPEQKVKYQSTF